MLRECSLTLCCVAAVTFGAGCSETTDIDTAAPPQDTAPRPPNPTPTPWITAVEPHQGFNDEPALAATPSGDVFVGWISYRNGADALVIARYSHEGDRFLKQDEWVALGGAGTYLLDLDAAADEAGAHFVFAREIEGNWDIYAIRVGASGPTQPIRIATGPESQIKPAAAWHDGTLFVAWESNADAKRRIYSASLRDGLVAEDVRVSADSPSNYGPSVAVDRHGRVSVSWHSYRDHNYDVYLRQRSTAGEWEEVSRLTSSPGIDRHPRLLAHDDDLWIVYEHARMERYNVGRTNERHLVAARVTPRGLDAPLDYWNSSPLAKARSEAASAAIDAQGRLWIAFMEPREPRGGWQARLVGFTGADWIGPRTLSQRRSLDRPAPMAIKGDRILLAFQADNFSDTWSQSDPDFTDSARSQILLASVDTGQAPPAAPAMSLAALEEPAEPFDPASLHAQYGEDAETPSIEYNGERFYLYYGELHEHSDISICNRCGDQSLDENYQCRRDINRLDFVAMTDHGYNIVPYLWNYSAKMVRANHDVGRLVTFLGEEWTSSFEDYDEQRPWGYYGHRNLIFADPYFPKWWTAYNGDSPADLWSELRAMKADFVQIPHQLADTGNVPVDWDYADEEAQPVAEIFQHRGSYEYAGAPRHAIRATGQPGSYIQDAWGQGLKIGVIASPDHGGGLGKAAVWAREKTRAAILEGIRARRTFGTTAARIQIDFRVNGRLMGEVVQSSGPVMITADVRSPQPIQSIEICRSNEFVYSTSPSESVAAIEFADQQPIEGPSFYYLRVTLEDGEIAWTSPVWLQE
ncbi:MAG: DUF3604 domain-containing protein [Bryobacterales bacterium]|nr:DUF3604 domain-containing protein [Bryobacterales bacterium]